MTSLPPSLLGAISLPSGLTHMASLLIIFGFIIALALLRRHYGDKASQRWHETARIALEKGQPLPNALLESGWGAGPWARRSRQGYLRRGLILVAVGAAFHLTGWSGHGGWDWTGDWSILPLCIGLAYLVLSCLTPSSGRPGDGGTPPDSGAS